MAEIFRVNIEFTGDREKLLRIPEKIEVPQYSILQWNIVNLDKYYFESEFWRRGLVFTIYFSDKSPFPWKRQFVQLREDPRILPYYPNRIIRLAEEVANEKGDFKYGVKVDEGESNEPLYDEDPFLIVF